MDKQTVITLLRKDIAELLQLTEGFDQMEQCPRVLIDLALQKTHSVEEALNALLNCSKNPQVEVQNAMVNEITEPAEKIVEESVIATVEKIMEEPKVSDTENVGETAVELEVDEKECIEEIVEEEIVEEQITPVETTDSIVESKEDFAEEGETELENVEEEIVEDIVEEEVVVEEVVKEEVIVEVTPKQEILTRNDSIVNSKIGDITKAISLGDRFLFQRELFGNNGEVMQKTIAHLNSLSSMEEAQTYLWKKFAWDKDSTTVERFLQLISRRYL